jgi:riboflavin kinase/FMN adenylyltransferase
MLIIKNSTFFPKGSAVTLGNFDGVHLGHQKLLAELVNKSKTLKIPSVVVLFEPQPSEFFNKDNNIIRLTSLREKLYFLKKIGIDAVLCLKFNHKLANLVPQDFIKEILMKRLNCKSLLIGNDYRFGKNRSGDYHTLQQYFKTNLKQFAPVIINNERVSSTKIRNAITEHNLVIAKDFLGHNLCLIGRVRHGNQMGSSWKVPTANIKLHPKQIGIRGVYCVAVYHNNNIYSGVANIGLRPTFNNNTAKNDLLLEIHLLEFSGDLYGKLIKIELLHWLRPEIKFTNKSELIAAIHNDVLQAKHFFNILPLREHNE